MKAVTGSSRLTAFYKYLIVYPKIFQGKELSPHERHDKAYMLTAYYKILSSLNLPDISELELSEYRRSKIRLCRTPHAKLLEYAAALTLKKGLSELGLKEEKMRYALTDSGKPFFPELPELHFSISHSGDMAITVFSDKNVGIDCEHSTRKIPKNLLRRFFNDDEAAVYKDCPLKLWVIKESLSKLSGEGLIKERKRMSIPGFDQSIILNGIRIGIYNISDYIVCVSSESSEECRFISI